MKHISVVARAAPGFEGEFGAAVDTAASALGVPFEAKWNGVPTDTLILLRDARGWALTDGSRGSPVRADFLDGPLAQRIREAPRGEGRLARALGLRTHPAPLVVDATAGLGRESLLAAALGCTVIACERSPIVAFLLRDGLARAAAGGLAEITSRITLHEGDARDLLATLTPRPDVVIVDPMFPERSKAAKARREMQILQQLLGPDEDEGALLDAAIAAASRRVVVKRPAHAPPVGGRRPAYSVEGRAARYDVYLTATGSSEEAARAED